MNKAKQAKKKRRSGPRPELFSLHPLTFDEAVERLVKAKPEKQPKQQIEENDTTDKRE